MIEAFVLIIVKPGNEDLVYDKLNGVSQVKEIYKVYGEYDIILRVEVDNIKALDEFHDTVLRKIREIEMTETLIASSYGS
ncbi:Lrp/AsnC ligand binding domain-containing protein [Thermococcus argininiproducens]|uniref:Lrp/AsnC ligand binding domain-containing protein n=1 Tax=Thermococcus argininiproducens TaxID=2866384 RepID=A0A9E7M9Z3_9EURY|nr:MULTISPECIES: Lrp/AsnC ligand binding domain-containing protein [Thermococcus]KPU62610.1 AsnC family transcriptional regulator [Thermococcus sp. EP1]NJE27000.1 Lrp/AsnC family transcriptional regulator [Thermococcus sp. MV5]USG99863.1 Lrp/AsnC ligand binding domain-containing protein [Thermococcus argininiproducens]